MKATCGKMTGCGVNGSKTASQRLCWEYSEGGMRSEDVAETEPQGAFGAQKEF